MEVRDGADGNAPLIGNRLSGSTVPSPILSSGNALYLKFHSDRMGFRSGYRILITTGMKLHHNINIYIYIYI